MSNSKTKPLRLSGEASSSSPPQKHQRVFTDSDETKLLEAYLQITSESTKPATTITRQSLDAIESSLSSRFSHNQIIDKLRRLRLKYHRQARTKSLIKTPHEQRLFSMAREIWGKRESTSKNRKRQRDETEFRSGSVEEEFGEVLREEFGEVLRGNLVWEKGLESLGREIVRDFNEKWELLRVKEAELATRKAELVNEFARVILEAIDS